jgi:hypothetical protein
MIGVVAVFGLSGVDKSWLISRFASAHSVRHVQASQLLRDAKAAISGNAIKDTCQTLDDWPLIFHADPHRKEWTSAAKRASLSPCRERPLATPLLRVPRLAVGSTDSEAGRSKTPALCDLYPQVERA